MANKGTPEISPAFSKAFHMNSWKLMVKVTFKMQFTWLPYRKGEVTSNTVVSIVNRLEELQTEQIDFAVQ